jgi:hypothetical protein
VARDSSCQAEIYLGLLGKRLRFQSERSIARQHDEQVDEKNWPPMNADERRLKTICLSAFICVHQRPKTFFSNL